MLYVSLFFIIKRDNGDFKLKKYKKKNKKIRDLLNVLLNYKMKI